MLIILIFQGFHVVVKEGVLENAGKDTTIFSNRCNYIEKLTLEDSKKSVSGC